jgi:hypothetical protein
MIRVLIVSSEVLGAGRDGRPPSAGQTDKLAVSIRDIELET